jgi:hypothetical protein
METYTVVVRDAWDVELDRVTRETEQAAFDAAFDRWDGGDYPLHYTLETEGERINCI